MPPAMGFALAVDPQRRQHRRRRFSRWCTTRRPAKASGTDFIWSRLSRPRATCTWTPRASVIDGKSLYTHHAGAVLWLHGACLEGGGTLPLSRVVGRPAVALADKGFGQRDSWPRSCSRNRRTWASGPPPRPSSGRTAPADEGGRPWCKTTWRSRMRLIGNAGRQAGLLRGHHRPENSAEMAPHAGALSLQDLEELQGGRARARAAATAATRS